jgi:hypothetical protein
MTTATKAPAPPLTIVMQLLGVLALVVGVHRVVVEAGCTELGCVGFAFGIFATVWGILAILSGLRGRKGLVFLVLAMTLPLLVLWIKFLIGFVFLAIVGVAASMSKDKLAGYYRSEGAS